MPESPVSFENVSHDYGEQEVLNDITCSIERDKITAVLGKSGSGKSTLLQMINGLVVPSAGTVQVFGEVIDYESLQDLRLRIGYSVQGAGLFPHMTVEENIVLPGKISGSHDLDMAERIKTLTRLVDLDAEYLKKYPFQLSGGEQQRVGICRAMLLNPGLFLLDEPFAALDPQTRKEIHRGLLNLQETEPRTIVLVTHDMAEAKKLADNIMIINDGIIEQFSSREDVMKKPDTDFVRRFIKEQDEEN